MTATDRARVGDGLRRAIVRPWQLTRAQRWSIEAFAERYAQARGLAHQVTAEMPRGTWFLSSLQASRSHSFMRGRLAGGPDGLLDGSSIRTLAWECLRREGRSGK